MTKKYRVLFHRLIRDKELFRARMVRLGVPAETVEKIVQKAPVILKEDMTLGSARRYADAVQEAGGRVTIQEYGNFEGSGRINRPVSIASFRDFTMCPECGFKQPKVEICVKCGFKLKRVEKEHGREDAPGY